MTYVMKDCSMNELSFSAECRIIYFAHFCCLALPKFPTFCCWHKFPSESPSSFIYAYSLDLSRFRSANASSAAYKNIQFMRVTRSCWPNLANVQNNPALFNWPISFSEIGRSLFLCSSIPVYKLDCARISQFLNLRHPHLS